MSDGLRQRKVSTEKTDGEKTISSSSALDVAAKYYEKAAPVIDKVTAFMQITGIPFMIHVYHQLQDLWILLQPYKPELLIPGFCGLIMCFFGGSFPMLIAAAEAYRLVGYESSLKCIRDLNDDFGKFLLASKQDDARDDDNDGISDVIQISKKELAQRKVLLFLKTVDPKRVTEAMAGLNGGFLAVIATLKLQFAKAITLGQAIGNIVEKPANIYCLPILHALLPEDYKRWAQPIISYSVKSIAISIAWFVQRVMSAFHSAIRGGHMFSKNVFEYLSKMGYVQIRQEDSHLFDEIIGYSVAIIGLWFQLSLGFSLPFPLNFLLLPFRTLEWTLIWIVSK